MHRFTPDQRCTQPLMRYNHGIQANGHECDGLEYHVSAITQHEESTDGRPLHHVAPAPRFLKPREFAVLVGVDEGTIYRAINRGEICAARIGTRHLIPVTEVDRLEAEAGAAP